MNHHQPSPEHPHNRLSSHIQSLIAAIRFLTLIPIPIPIPAASHQQGDTENEAEEFAIPKMMPWFPAVGALIGVILLVAGWISGVFWGEAARAVVIVVVWAIVTAGFHLDGLSDTFDAVMSWRPQARKLEIMKDSRIGVMGALALIAVLLLKCVWLYDVSSGEGGVGWWQAVLLAPIIGRWANLCGIFWFPAAREGGLGRTFHRDIAPNQFLVPTIAVGVATLVIGQAAGVVAMLFALGGTYLLAKWWTRDLGGLTGDTYGAMCEIAETIVLAAMAAAG